MEDGSGSVQISNNYGRACNEGLFTIFGDILIEDDYVYIELNPDYIPKNLTVEVKDDIVWIKYYNDVKEISLPCKVKKVEHLSKDKGIIDIKLKR